MVAFASRTDGAEHAYMDEILAGLNEAQKIAVTSPSDVLQVLAPPGSGKTKTLTARVAYLIAHNGFLPRNIIVCTFTVKAAREMKERIQGFLGIDLASKLVLGTFHSIARRFLVSHGKHIGVDSKFGIADSSDSSAIITRIIKRLRLSIVPAQARNRISRHKAQSVGAGDLLAGAKNLDQQEFATVYSEYEEHLKTSNLLDYDDLLLRCAELLRRLPSCVNHIQAVLIDEFQDTNNVQYDLMHLFAQRRNVITIVGDPDQSIYGFRSAEMKNLMRMQEEYPEVHVANLEENYRSSGAILLAALEVIEQDPSRPPKPLLPTHSVGMSPVLRYLPSAGIEASWLVSEIQRTVALSGGLLNHNDFAVLLRSASLSRLIEAALGKAGIQYRMVGGHRFFDRLEVKVLLDYLRVLDHPSHNDALARVLNVPSRKIGDVTIQGLLAEADARRLPLWSIVLDLAQGRQTTQLKIPSQAQKGLESFVNIILTTRKRLLDVNNTIDALPEFLQSLVKKIGLEEYLKRSKPDEFELRWANVKELIAQASDIVTQAVKDNFHMYSGEEEAMQGDSLVAETPETMQDALAHFLANVALSTEVQKAEENGQIHAQVTLSTIHAAKGLEWPVVFIPAAYDGSIPHSRAEDTDEERRLLYVAMTRAQSLLYLSCPCRDSQGSQTTLSQFLSDKRMRSRFAGIGPSLRFEGVKELAGILRRPCPPASVVEKAYVQLEHVEDDQWVPQTHQDWAAEQDDDFCDDEMAEMDHNRFAKRPRSSLQWSSKRAYEPTTTVPGFAARTTMDQVSRPMQNGKSTMSFSTSFTTAAKTLEMQGPAAYDVERDNTQQPQAIKQKPETKKARANAAAGQRTLNSFFQQPKPAVEQPSQPGSTLAHPPTKPLRDISDEPATNIVRGSVSITGAKLVRPATSLHSTSIARVAETQAQRKTLGMKRSLVGWPPQATGGTAQPALRSGVHAAFKSPFLDGKRR